MRPARRPIGDPASNRRIVPVVYARPDLALSRPGTTVGAGRYVTVAPGSPLLRIRAAMLPNWCLASLLELHLASLRSCWIAR